MTNICIGKVGNWKYPQLVVESRGVDENNMDSNVF